MNLEAFLGVWVLAPEGGGAPVAVYTILGDEKRLFFHARWSADGMHEVRSEGVPDGALYSVGDLQKRLTFVDGALVTEVHEDGKIVHRAKRTVVDGKLHVEQTGQTVVYTRSEVKQVLVYRADLNMRKGKIASQCAHASMAVFFERNQGAVDRLHMPLDGPMAAWCQGAFTKIVLSVADEKALFQVYSEAQKRGLPSTVITDPGDTDFGGVPTRTIVAVGPAAAGEINAITAPGGLVPTKLV